MAVGGMQFQLFVILLLLQLCSLVTWPKRVIEPVLWHKCLQSAKGIHAWMRQFVGEFFKQAIHMCIKSITNFHVYSLTKDETQIFYILVNLFLFTNFNGQKLSVFKTNGETWTRATTLNILAFLFSPNGSYSPTNTEIRTKSNTTVCANYYNY